MIGQRNNCNNHSRWQKNIDLVNWTRVYIPLDCIALEHLDHNKLFLVRPPFHMADPSSRSSKRHPICHFWVDRAWSGFKCGVIWLVRQGMGHFWSVLGWPLFFSVCVLHCQAFRGCLGAFSSICNILRSLCLTVASSAALRRCIVTDETVGAAATITIWSNGSMKRKHLFQQHDAPIQMVSTWGKWHISAGFWPKRCFHFSGEVILTFFGRYRIIEMLIWINVLFFWFVWRTNLFIVISLC